MDIIVCIKRVPETAEADIVLNAGENGIDTDGMVFSINEWDNYAVEAAIQLKEAQGGKITVVSAGPEENNEVLRRALAMGADDAIRLTDPAFEGADSRVLLKHVSSIVAEKGYRLVNADITIIAQAPKMAPHINAMRDNIASDLEVALDCINVKATTTERLGFEGRSEGIAVQAVVLMTDGLS
jgi:hypothetical protein